VSIREREEGKGGETAGAAAVEMDPEDAQLRHDLAAIQAARDKGK
jgi:hypothetical protein